MEGGKVVVDFPNYHQTSEIVGDKLVEVSVLLAPGRPGCFCAHSEGPGEAGPGQLAVGALP